MNTKQIINAIKLHYNIKTDTEFANKLGIKQNTLATWYARNTLDYGLIISKCDEIDANWLHTGEGEMLKKKNAVDKLNKIVDAVKSGINKEQDIPVYDTLATAGIVSIFTENSKSIPLEYIKIPRLPKVDGAVHIVGDSMHPLLKSGDLVIYKEVNQLHNIIWGEMYLIHIVDNGDEMLLVKYIQKSEKEDHIQLVSYNPHHQTKEYPLSSVKKIAHIKASIRYNSSI